MNASWPCQSLPGESCYPIVKVGVNDSTYANIPVPIRTTQSSSLDGAEEFMSGEGNETFRCDAHNFVNEDFCHENIIVL